MTSPRRHPFALPGLALATALLLGGCAGTAADANGEPSTELTAGLIASPATLDFTTTAGAAIPQALLYNVYEGLVKIDNEGEIQPLLASAYTVSDDRTVYTFDLQPNVTFSNGSPFTAETVKFSLERVKENWTANSPKYLDPIASIEVLSELQVAITLSTPSNSWLFNMAGPVGTMFSPDGVDALATTPVGTGPYTVSDFRTGESLTLQLRDDYWGAMPAMTQVTLRYFADATAQSNALLSGDIDLLPALAQYQLIDKFESEPTLTVLEGTSTGETTLSMNNASGAFSDIRVRQAVMHAIDRDAVMATANSGYGLVLGSMVPPTDPWYDESLVDLYPYDPTTALSLLEKADATDLEIALKVPNLPYATAAAQVVADQLKAVGITANVTVLEFPAVWLDEVFTDHNYDMSIIAHTEPRDVTAFAAPGYYAGYDNPAVQELFAEADASDYDSYVTLMKKATRTMAEDAAANWLYLQPQVTVANANLRGIPLNATTLSLDLSTLSW
jgi:peptide/nickel transport system substrate-binding protein